MEDLKTCRDAILKINDITPIIEARIEYKFIYKDSRSHINLRSPIKKDITDDWKILSIKRGSCDKSLMDNVFFDLQEGIVRELELIFTREWPVVYDSSPEINSTPFTLFGRDFFVYHDAYQMKHMECWVLNEKEMTHYNIKNTALFSPPTKWKRNGKTIWGKRSNSTIDLPF